jgi:hypothetical protein
MSTASKQDAIDVLRGKRLNVPHVLDNGEGVGAQAKAVIHNTIIEAIVEGDKTDLGKKLE